MKIIFDCGSTKTSVAIISSDSPTLHLDLANGYNALTGGDDELRSLISSHPAMDPSRIPAKQIHYYGAGCATPQACHRVGSQLAGIFPQAEIHINSDMLGAARAVCGDAPGIVGILGTGSNSCLYDGKEITANVSPLGYILGDEGSGAVLGRHLIGDVLKHQLPRELCDRFMDEYNLESAAILRRVYKEPMPNRFLASVTPFISKRLDVPEIKAMVLGAFTAFFRRNIMQYPGYDKHKVNFVGSIAHYFRPVLEEAAAATGCTIGTILRSPMDGLIKFHSNN